MTATLPWTLLQRTLARKKASRELIAEVAKMSPIAQEQLRRLLTGMEQELHNEKQKRRRGQWW